MTKRTLQARRRPAISRVPRWITAPRCKNGIFTVNLDRGPGLQEKVGASRRHQIRGSHFPASTKLA